MSSTNQWSLEPLLHGYLPNEILEGIYTDISFIKFTILLIISLSIMHPSMHTLLSKYSWSYRSLGASSKQIVVTHHALETIILFAILPFDTYFIVRSCFRESDLDEAIADFKGIMRCAIFIAFTYAFELSSRFEEGRPIIIFHHLLSISLIILSVYFPTILVCKTCGILSYFVCFEALTFMGLFMYRIFPESPITPKIIFSGMICFGITRPIQVIWIGAAIFGDWNAEHVVKWQGIMQLIITLILTALQVFTLTIHYGVWQRCIAKRTKSDKDVIVKKDPSGAEEMGEHEDIENASCHEEVVGPSGGHTSVVRNTGTRAVKISSDL